MHLHYLVKVLGSPIISIINCPSCCKKRENYRNHRLLLFTSLGRDQIFFWRRQTRLNGPIFELFNWFARCLLLFLAIWSPPESRSDDLRKNWLFLLCLGGSHNPIGELWRSYFLVLIQTRRLLAWPRLLAADYPLKGCSIWRIQRKFLTFMRAITSGIALWWVLFLFRISSIFTWSDSRCVFSSEFSFCRFFPCSTLFFREEFARLYSIGSFLFWNSDTA